MSQWAVAVLWIMAIYQEAKIKIINTKLNKWKFATQNKTETMLRVNKKYFEDEKLPKEVFLTTRQTINTDPGGFFRVFVCLFVFFFFLRFGFKRGGRG